MRRRLFLFALLIGLAIPAQAAASPHSLRFFGNGYGDIDRVKIRVDDPTTSNEPKRPADLGATSLTIEFWMKAAAGNTAGAQTCGWGNVNWIYGNIVVDRDRYNQGRKFGLSMAAGRLVFGVTNGSGQSRTICGVTDLRDGKWHHVAVQRRRSDGMLWIWVDGELDAKGDGPNGDVSYPDGGVPGDYCGGPCTKSDPFLVIGAEKHDAGSSFPSYHGWIDELRLSDVLRYKAAFTPRRRRFSVDAGTAALYHMNEGSGNVIGDVRGLSDGVRRFGGDPAGPVWSSSTPF
jgi:hypothetical protein